MRIHPSSQLRFRLILASSLLLVTAPRALAQNASTECLIEFDGVPSGFEDGSASPLACTDCDPACDSDSPGQANGSCTFDMAVCLNQERTGCSPAAALVKTKVKPAKAGLTAAQPCGPTTGVVVNTKRGGKKLGKLKVKTMAKSSDRRVDKDKLVLVCNPRSAGEACPTTSTTTTTTTTTTTVTFPPTNCEPIVPGNPIPGTYSLESTSGPMLCGTRATVNRFGPCTSDADCGDTPTSCQACCAATPWVTVGNLPPQALPVGSTTVFVVAQEATPTQGCNHQVCIGCGNPDAACTGIPGCVDNPSCVRATCCDAPKLRIPSIVIAGLGVCVRVDQIACGVGVINTSNPQVGDNEINKRADTSDPGADCIYGTGDDPAAKPCTAGSGGASADTKGKIVRTTGNGVADAPGIQYSFVSPQLSTAWSGDNAGCPSTATFDPGELLLTQLVLQAEPSTAGVSAGFEDMNLDGCSRGTGTAGFGGGVGDGPVEVSTPPLVPMPYAGGPSVSAAAGIALSNVLPAGFDIGFVAITPNLAVTVEPSETCTCTPVTGCPE